jgi:predicted dehydrogenase
MSLNRRQFVHLGSAAAALALRPRVRAENSPNAKLNHACIGVTGQGGSDMNSLASHPRLRVAALVDVDQANLDKAKAAFPEARTYRDYREMLAAEGDRIDSVSVGLPDHMHAPISLSAMAHGKHVYCEKPLTQTVAEARRMREMAEKKGVITQMGNQIHSHIAYRMGVAWLRGGAIGRIKEVHSWINARFPQEPRKSVADPVPANLDWNLWLGVAPERPFVKGVYHPFQWRGWQDFGGGGMGDFGCHILDPVFTALDLNAPVSLTAEVNPEWSGNEARFKDSWPDWEIIRFTFPGNPRIAGPTLPITWYDGGKKPDAGLVKLPEGRNLPDGGSLFIGEEGSMLLPHVNGPLMLPEEKFKAYPKPDIPKGIDHYHTWVDHVLEGKRTSDGFHYAGPLTEAVQLGNIANRFPGQTLNWDPVKFELTGHAAGTALLDRAYRPGWLV